MRIDVVKVTPELRVHVTNGHVYFNNLLCLGSAMLGDLQQDFPGHKCLQFSSARDDVSLAGGRCVTPIETQLA